MRDVDVDGDDTDSPCRLEMNHSYLIRFGMLTRGTISESYV